MVPPPNWWGWQGGAAPPWGFMDPSVFTGHSFPLWALPLSYASLCMTCWKSFLLCGTLNYSDISYLLWLTHKEVVCFGFCTTRPIGGWAVLNRQVATVQILKRTDLQENQANKAMLPKLLHGFTQRKRPQHVLAGMSTKCSGGTQGPSYTHTDTAAHFQTEVLLPSVCHTYESGLWQHQCLRHNCEQSTLSNCALVLRANAGAGRNLFQQTTICFSVNNVKLL